MIDKYKQLAGFGFLNNALNPQCMEHYTNIFLHESAYMTKKFELKGTFTAKTIRQKRNSMLLRCVGITVASGGFGAVMGLLMSGYEFQSNTFIDTSRSNTSQMKQHYFGLGRFMKNQILGFMKFGFYISVLEIPIEIILGKLNTPAMFVSGGFTGVLMESRKLSLPQYMRKFLSTGLFIGMFGIFMNRGSD